MKNIITLLITLYSFTINAQVSMFIESGVSSLGSNNHVGIQYQPKRGKIGFYATCGGNLFDKMLKSNIRPTFDCKGTFTSTVPWYTKNGSYYPQYPPSKYFTSSEWGNSLIETGKCVNTVETWDGEITSSVEIYNVGLVINNGKNLNYRVGVGIRKLNQNGYTDYRFWQHTYYVSKYYDEWGVIAQPSGIFTVAHSGSVRAYDNTTYSTLNKIELNINLSVEYSLSNKTTISLGYNTKGGINMGIGFPLVSTNNSSKSYYNTHSSSNRGSVQCTGTTKAGNRCKNRTTSYTHRCHLH